ncbi:MAG: hypothetical protein RMH74_04815 [Candidatus Caldarchaeum sp.]|nr:hypothetical protein [Candidatus Caldarchaeum sp.]
MYSAVLAAGLAAAYAWPVWWDVQPFTRMFPQQTPFSYGPPRMMPGGMAGLCPCLGWYGGQTGPRLTIQQAVDVLERYVAGLGQNLRLHEVMEFQRNFYAVVVERDSGVGAFELLVNPYTGSVSPEPGPNMMWNTKYGMHFTMTGWSFSPTADMPITSEQAEQIAFNYLRNRFTGLVEVEHPTRFYGYYTLDYMLDGRVHGMLSVNGYTGQVWYHGWHGQFIQEVELEEEH